MAHEYVPEPLAYPKWPLPVERLIMGLEALAVPIVIWANQGLRHNEALMASQSGHTAMTIAVLFPLTLILAPPLALGAHRLRWRAAVMPILAIPLVWAVAVTLVLWSY
jgi:hypothetical protein